MRLFRRGCRLRPILRASVFVLFSSYVFTAGCVKSKLATTTRVPPVQNVNSKGLAKLSPSDIDKKIQAVQANASIPESAKPNIITSIRAQGEP